MAHEQHYDLWHNAAAAKAHMRRMQEYAMGMYQWRMGVSGLPRKESEEEIMGRPYDPMSGLVSLLIVFALLAAIVGGTVVYIFLVVTGRLVPPAPLPPDEAMTPEQRVLTPGYGLSPAQEPDLPYPTPEAAPRYMREAERAARRAELRHNDYKQGEWT